MTTIQLFILNFCVNLFQYYERHTFDCRICQLPTRELVVDYFRWRNEDAYRNALYSHCYWLARQQGATPDAANARFSGMSMADKNEYLFQHGINFNNLPNWQKRGVGLYWETYAKVARNPKTGETVQALRRRLTVDMELPMKADYSAFIADLLADTASSANVG